MTDSYSASCLIQIILERFGRCDEEKRTFWVDFSYRVGSYVMDHMIWTISNSLWFKMYILNVFIFDQEHDKQQIRRQFNFLCPSNRNGVWNAICVRQFTVKVLCPKSLSHNNAEIQNLFIWQGIHYLYSDLDYSK